MFKTLLAAYQLVCCFFVGLYAPLATNDTTWSHRDVTHLFIGSNIVTALQLALTKVYITRGYTFARGFAIVFPIELFRAALFCASPASRLHSADSLAI